MIIYEEQTIEWKQEFQDSFKLQGLYGEDCPDLWSKLFKNAKYSQGSVTEAHRPHDKVSKPEEMCSTPSSAILEYFEEIVK